MFLMRLSMRQAPEAGVTSSEYYRAALEMGDFADEHGFIGIQLPQHHASPDGYLPSPLVLASALAARTERVPIMCMALLLLHYDPVKLAEDMAVLDIISRGRVSYVIGLGYRPEERAMFGVAPDSLASAMDEAIVLLRAALGGEEFEHPQRGPVRVTPRPHTPGGPVLSYGGHSLAAARRAARHGMALFAETSRPELEQAYADEAARCGVEPVGCVLTERGTPTSLFVAEDPDRAWAEVGPYMLRDAAGYDQWNVGRPDEIKETIASLSSARTVDDLRAEHGSYRICTPAEARARIASGGVLCLDPLCGGLPPDLAWPYLRTAVEAASAA
jgi:alkanesulfonate monooxygenase SsuD/methylene tetrahydromethanopterin reductase-like flavin-dependent oxidoreductase (luciferase family)